MLSPRNVLFGYILSELDKAISIFKTAANDAKQQRITKNLHWLVKLRKQAMDGYKASMAAEPESLLTHRSPITDNPDVTDHLSMLGWRTRLISRASPNEKVATTIASKSDAESLQALLFPSPAVANDTGQREGGDASDLEWQSSADWVSAPLKNLRSRLYELMLRPHDSFSSSGMPHSANLLLLDLAIRW